MNDDVKAAAIIVAIVIAVIFLLAKASLAIEGRECKTYAEQTGRETKYVRAQCFVRVKGEWFYLKQVRPTND